MKFRFQPLRATQAASLLLGLAGGRLDYTMLLKLLYLADRRALLETGSTITGDEVVNMARGQVLSAVYDCIKGNRQGDCVSWSRYLHTEGKDLVRISDAGDGELSDYDVELLTEVYDAHRTTSLEQVIEELHQLHEWKDPKPDKSQNVPYEDILRAGDLSEETISAYVALNASTHSLDSLRLVRP